MSTHYGDQGNLPPLPVNTGAGTLLGAVTKRSGDPNAATILLSEAVD